MSLKKKGTPEKLKVVKESEKELKALLESIDLTPVTTGRVSGKKKKETK